MRRGCRHALSRRERYVWRAGGGGIKTWFTCASFETPDVEFCLMCDDYLGLGPSQDAGPHAEAVAVEIDAAHVAATWHEPDRAAYWLTIEALSDPNGRNAAVIDLARVIADHGREEEG